MNTSLCVLTLPFKYPQVMKSASHTQSWKNSGYREYCLFLRIKAGKELSQPWIISSLSRMWLWLDIPAVFLQLALGMHWASRSLCKIEQSRQVWEPEGRGWLGCSVVLLPFPDGALLDLFIIPWRRRIIGCSFQNEHRHIIPPSFGQVDFRFCWEGP